MRILFRILRTAILRKRVLASIIILGLGGGFCAFNAIAGVYHCQRDSGNNEFRDTPCPRDTQQAGFLPYVYHKTDPKNTLNQEEERQQAQKTQKFLTQIKAQEKREQRKQKRLQKEAEKQALKDKRREMRCLRTKENIKEIEQQLRLGCKLHKSNQLKAKLQHYEKMKDRYCSLNPHLNSP